MDHVVIEPDRESFERVIHALRDEADGGEWERDTAEAMEEALRPGVMAVRAALFSLMHTTGLPHAGEPLRMAVAAAVRPVVKFRGEGAAGARIRVSKVGMPRGFRNAPRRLNDKSWRHPTFDGSWVVQVGAPGWFDATLDRTHHQLRQAAERALERRARRISRKAP